MKSQRSHALGAALTAFALAVFGASAAAQEKGSLTQDERAQRAFFNGDQTKALTEISSEMNAAIEEALADSPALKERLQIGASKIWASKAIETRIEVARAFQKAHLEDYTTALSKSGIDLEEYAARFAAALNAKSEEKGGWIVTVTPMAYFVVSAPPAPKTDEVGQTKQGLDSDPNKRAPAARTLTASDFRSAAQRGCGLGAGGAVTLSPPDRLHVVGTSGFLGGCVNNGTLTVDTPKGTKVRSSADLRTHGVAAGAGLFSFCGLTSRAIHFDPGAEARIAFAMWAPIFWVAVEDRSTNFKIDHVSNGSSLQFEGNVWTISAITVGGADCHARVDNISTTVSP
jgi:hypothetical protein